MTEFSSDRCGYIWPEDFDPHDPKAICQSCCYRPTWREHDRCIWHAETDEQKPPEELEECRETTANRALNRGAEAPPAELLDGAYLDGDDLTDVGSFTACMLRDIVLTNADLSHADLPDAHLEGANLSGANLRGADLSDANFSDADLPEANLSHTDLSEANLIHADLPNATLTDADLSNANIRDATLWYATLEDTVLTTADCRGTDFRSARLYQAILRDTRINSTTQFVNQGGDFFGKCTYEYSPDEILADDEDKFDYECHPYEAAWTYRRLQSLHEENALSEHTRDFHIRKEEVQRKNHHRVGNYPTWTVATLSKCLTNYGESFKHLFLTWGVTILTFGVLYPAVSLPIVRTNTTAFK